MWILRAVAVTMALALAPSAPAQAAGQAPDPKVCNDATNPPQDAVTQGGCIAIARAKGNCQACHFIAGATSGNIGPPLAGMTQRFPNRARLRAQLQDPAEFNRQTVMPPYGKHEILTSDEIEKVITWLLTL